MKFPCLVRPWTCKTSVSIVVYGERITEDGAPEIICEGNFLCNYQDSAKTVFTAQQKRVDINGAIFIPGDICPESAVISSGYVEINGERREIAKGVKARNPDGTVNFTELDVI